MPKLDDAMVGSKYSWKNLSKKCNPASANEKVQLRFFVWSHPVSSQWDVIKGCRTWSSESFENNVKCTWRRNV